MYGKNVREYCHYGIFLQHTAKMTTNKCISSQELSWEYQESYMAD